MEYTTWNVQIEKAVIGIPTDPCAKQMLEGMVSTFGTECRHGFAPTVPVASTELHKM